jgi:hypothetical protein
MQNQMQDAMQIWDNICSSAFFKKTSFVRAPYSATVVWTCAHAPQMLFLNKRDLFLNKIHQSHIDAHFPVRPPPCGVRAALTARAGLRRQARGRGGRDPVLPEALRAPFREGLGRPQNLPTVGVPPPPRAMHALTARPCSVTTATDTALLRKVIISVEEYVPSARPAHVILRAKIPSSIILRKNLEGAAIM